MKRQGETQFIREIDGFMSPPLPFDGNVFFCKFFLSLTLFITKFTILMLYLNFFTNKYIIYLLYTFNDHTFLQIHIS
jgi:hypothetical protein